MHVRILLAVGLTGVVALACSGSGGSYSGGPDPSGTGADGGPSADPDDPANQPPHALGTIVLGESHLGGSSEARPLVSVTFVPDAAKAAACRKPEVLGGCSIVAAPKCATDCGLDEACLVDAATCAPSCAKVPQCTDPCAKDETCRLADPKTGEGTCTKTESFDAGPIAFAGTTTPITLYPPYDYKSDAKGAPFLAGAEIQVQAQGATGAGFAAFDAKFTATTFLQTTPSLDKIPREAAFGTGPLPVAWAPGHDTIVVTVSGAGGVATCTVDDKLGKLDVPREVVDRVRGDATAPDSSTLTLSVARQKKDVKKDGKAKGPLASTPVQPVGWVELVTTSVESATLEGCPAKQAACGDACVDPDTDAKNCGSCGHACDGAACVKGACVAGGCVAGPENTLAACSDGCSNDGDIYVDCDDFDCCSVRSDCPATSSCGKGK